MSKLLLYPFLFFQSTSAVAITKDGIWHAGIGDPTLLGWITVIAYCVATLRCVFKASKLDKNEANYRFWAYLAIFLLLLAINKQLDLQSWFTQAMRSVAQTQGWYANRKSLQLLFIAFLSVGMLLSLLSIRLYLAQSWHNYPLTWVGIVLLSTFILMRAASFSHIDQMIHYPIFGIRLNGVMEIGSIALIIFGSYFNKQPRKALS